MEVHFEYFTARPEESIYDFHPHSVTEVNDEVPSRCKVSWER